MGRHDERQKVLHARASRYERTGETPATDAAKRKARKAAWRKELEPFQERINAHHAAWVAAGMPADFPKMEDWEVTAKTGVSA
ncbi:hypothetical protein [Afipia felis]|uniref:hypothetical protein n=1 Tax=Afipia felis TaxID=1035 RepID=UPI000AFC6F7F|nr:hypothetical protein [Afipia felis]